MQDDDEEAALEELEAEAERAGIRWESVRDPNDPNFNREKRPDGFR